MPLGVTGDASDVQDLSSFDWVSIFRRNSRRSMIPELLQNVTASTSANSVTVQETVACRLTSSSTAKADNSSGGKEEVCSRETFSRFWVRFSALPKFLFPGLLLDTEHMDAAVI